MSRFGIRKKLKGALKKAILGDQPEPSTTPTPAPKPAPAAAKAKPAPEPKAKAEAAPKPKAKPKPSKGAPAPTAKPSENLGRSWVQAAGVRPDEVVPGTVHVVQIFGSRYALYKTDEGSFFATSDSCPHAGGPLGEGELDGFEVSCPFHSWTFDVRDGSCTSGQGMDVDCTEVRVTDDMVMLEVPL